MMMGLAVAALPAIAPSTQVCSVLAVKLSASTRTAAASPPEVHQWVTSRSVAWAIPAGSASDAASPSAVLTERILHPP